MSRPACAVPALLLMAAALPAVAVESSEADFGIQPVAIGAGARALGMGGAFSAVADDATAVTWNPAGLTQCERPEAAISLGYYRSDIRAPEAGTTRDEELDLDHASALLPFFAFGCMQVVGVAWQRQYDFTRSLGWREDFVDVGVPIEVHGSSSRASEGSFSSLGLSYAIEPHPGLSLGVSLNAWSDRLTGASSYRTEGHSRTDTDLSFMQVLQIYDTSSEVEVEAGWNMVLGGFWQATPALTLAVVARPAYTLRLERDNRTHSYNEDSFGAITESNWEVTSQVELRHPSSLTVGGAWRHADRHIVSCDATVTRWSQYRIKDDLGSYSPVSSQLDPEAFSSLWTVRLGYEYVAILPRAILVPRLGLLIEDLPAATVAPSLAALDQVAASSDRWWGATAGLSLCRRNWVWDLGAQVRYGEDVGAGQFAAENSRVDILATTIRLGCTVMF